MLVYLNEEGKYLPPHIVGLQDNYEEADCCGIEDKTDLANGSLIAAAPDLLDACEAAVIALFKNSQDRPLSEDNLNTINLCRAACAKAHAS